MLWHKTVDHMPMSSCALSDRLHVLFRIILASIITPPTTALNLEASHLSARMSLEASLALYGHKFID